MAASLFNVNLTLPLVLLVFLAFVQVFKVVFFDPIMDIKEKRRLTLEKLNAEVNYGSKNTFNQEERLKQEVLTTQRMIQDVYQWHVTKAQMVSAQAIQERKRKLSDELNAHVAAETVRAQSVQDELAKHTDAFTHQISKKLLSS